MANADNNIEFTIFHSALVKAENEKEKPVRDGKWKFHFVHRISYP